MRNVGTGSCLNYTHTHPKLVWLPEKHLGEAGWVRTETFLIGLTVSPSPPVLLSELVVFSLFVRQLLLMRCQKCRRCWGVLSQCLVAVLTGSWVRLSAMSLLNPRCNTAFASYPEGRWLASRSFVALNLLLPPCLLSTSSHYRPAATQSRGKQLDGCSGALGSQRAPDLLSLDAAREPAQTFPSLPSLALPYLLRAWGIMQRNGGV